MSDPVKLLRMYTHESAYFGDHKMFEVITARARAAGVAGATVIRAVVGFGHTPHEHRRHMLDDDQSVIIEILDTEPRLRAFFESLSDMEHIGPAILETVEVLHWPPASNGHSTRVPT